MDDSHLTAICSISAT